MIDTKAQNNNKPSKIRPAAVPADPPNSTPCSRRNLLRGAIWAATTGTYYSTAGTIPRASAAYRVERTEPDENETYAAAQNIDGPLRVLWVGAGTLNGVFRDLFLPGAEVTALDLVRPSARELTAATAYASERGGYTLRFEKGDATHLRFGDGTFDVVLSSMFLCQDFDPEVVVGEIRRVLRPGGRFGFFEHVEDIDTVIVGKVFGESSVVRVQHYPEKFNVMAGVVRKV